MLDCEQSLFFFRFQGGVHAPVSVSRAFCSTDQEKRWYGVFVRAKSYNPNVNVSLKVKGGETGTKRATLPLLVVKTRFVKHHRGEKLSSLLR